MKAIIDTNVLMSGIFWNGTPRQILQAWSDRRFTLVLSAEIFQEYNRVFDELKKKYSLLEDHKILEILSFYSELIRPNKLSQQICSDPDDDKFIAAALAAKVNFIVTGDKALLKVNGFNQINIVKPIEFFKCLK